MAESAHYSTEWWESQTYRDALGVADKKRRMRWRIAWAALAGWMPAALGNSWRLRLLARFGLKGGGWSRIYPTARIWAPWNVEMGRFVAIDDQVNLYSVDKIRIGSKVAISREAMICTASHDISKPARPLVTAPITICDGAWIGARAIVLPGVTIGEGAIVGAGAVVARDVEPWAVVAGNPARTVKKRTFEDA